MADGTPSPSPSVAIGAACLALFAVAAVMAPLLAPYDPTLTSGQPLLAPTARHLLGTNDIGQDLLSQWLWGARSTLLVGLLVALLSTALSWTVGLAAGLWPRAQGPLVGLTELLLALPALPLYLLVLVLLGPGQRTVVVVLGVLSWPAFARIVRVQVLVTRQAPFVEAAYALGARRTRIALLHVLPATLNLLPAKLILTVRFAVFADATLAFLGLADQSTPAWGTMLGWAFNDPLLFTRGMWPWWVLPPAVGIALVVLSTTWLATGVEDWLEVRPGRPASDPPAA
jgi:peptide/nickel transport system permease protein